MGPPSCPPRCNPGPDSQTCHVKHFCSFSLKMEENSAGSAGGEKKAKQPPAAPSKPLFSVWEAECSNFKGLNFQSFQVCRNLGLLGALQSLAQEGRVSDRRHSSTHTGCMGTILSAASPSLPGARWGHPFLPPASRRVPPWPGKIPWRRIWQPTPVFLPKETHGQRSLAATVHRVTQSQN